MGLDPHGNAETHSVEQDLPRVLWRRSCQHVRPALPPWIFLSFQIPGGITTTTATAATYYYYYYYYCYYYYYYCCYYYYYCYCHYSLGLPIGIARHHYCSTTTMATATTAPEHDY